MSATLKIKKLNGNAILPRYASAGAAGLDLTAISVVEVEHPAFGQIIYSEYDTGIAVEIPTGYVGLLFPRSSCSNYAQILANCVGVVDSDFRGSLKFRFKSLGDGMPKYRVGERVGQLVLVPAPQVEIKLVEDLVETERGTQGWGSSGK